MENKQKIDALIFFILVFIAVLFPWLADGTPWGNPFVWSVVITAPVSIYLGIRKKKNWRKIFAGALVFGSLFGFALEFLANINSVWQEPTIFGSRVLGVVSWESILFYPIMTIFILVFYEHFFDRDITKKVSSHIWIATIPSILAIVFMVTRYLLVSNSFQMPYTYLILGTLAIIIPLIHCIKKPKLFNKYSKVAVSMFLLFFTFEVVGVAFGYWYFPGSQYIGTVTAFGQTFPLEEVIFWMFFYPATIVSYYETFIDDMR